MQDLFGVGVQDWVVGCKGASSGARGGSRRLEGAGRAWGGGKRHLLSCVAAAFQGEPPQKEEGKSGPRSKLGTAETRTRSDPVPALDFHKPRVLASWRSRKWSSSALTAAGRCKAFQAPLCGGTHMDFWCSNGWSRCGPRQAFQDQPIFRSMGAGAKYELASTPVPLSGSEITGGPLPRLAKRLDS